MHVKCPTEKSLQQLSHLIDQLDLRGVFTVGVNHFVIPSEPEHTLSFRSRQEVTGTSHPVVRTLVVSCFSRGRRGILELCLCGLSSFVASPIHSRGWPRRDCSGGARRMSVGPGASTCLPVPGAVHLSRGQVSDCRTPM